jgi:hypothetical protein
MFIVIFFTFLGGTWGLNSGVLEPLRQPSEFLFMAGLYFICDYKGRTIRLQGFFSFYSCLKSSVVVFVLFLFMGVFFFLERINVCLALI